MRSVRFSENSTHCACARSIEIKFCYLELSSDEVSDDKERRHAGVAELDVVDGEDEDEVSGDYHGEQDARGARVQALAEEGLSRREAHASVSLLHVQHAWLEVSVQSRRDAARVHRHQVAAHAVDDRLEDGEALKVLHHSLQDQTARTEGRNSEFRRLLHHKL